MWSSCQKRWAAAYPLLCLPLTKKFDAWSPAGHTGTFRGNQLAMAAGYNVLTQISQNNLADNARIQGEFLRTELQKIASQYPCIGHVRGCGLMMGIEIVDERQEADHMGSYPADGELAAAIQKKPVLIINCCWSVVVVAVRSCVFCVRLPSLPTSVNRSSLALKKGGGRSGESSAWLTLSG